MVALSLVSYNPLTHDVTAGDVVLSKDQASVFSYLTPTGDLTADWQITFPDGYFALYHVNTNAVTHNGHNVIMNSGANSHSLSTPNVYTVAVSATGFAVLPTVPQETYLDAFALMPPDNSATIAINAAFLLPQDGPTNGTSITRASTSTFNLVDAGHYQVFFQASIAEAAQIGIRLNGTLLLSSVVGRATLTNQLVINKIISVGAGTVLEIINANSAAALTLTVSAGGSNSVSANLGIRRLK